jgi:hypothetical protein
MEPPERAAPLGLIYGFVGPPMLAAAALSGGLGNALDHLKASGSLTNPADTGLFSI